MRLGPCPALSWQVDQLARDLCLFSSEGPEEVRPPTTASTSALGATMQSFAWGGQVVWQNGASETASSLGPVLAGLGGGNSQSGAAGYVERTLHPLIFPMVVEAVKAMPDDPALFFLEWLLRYVSAPDDCAAPVLRWLNQRWESKASSYDRKRSGGMMDRSHGASSQCVSNSEASEEDDSPTEHGNLASGDNNWARASSEHSARSTRGNSILKKPGSFQRPTGNRSRQASIQLEGAEVSSLAAPKTHSFFELGVFEGSKRRRSSARIVLSSTEQILALLMSVPILKDLDHEDLVAIADRAKVRAYDAHAEIMRCGDISSELLVVMSGKCRVLVPEFRRALGPGDCFNEAALLKGEAAVEAMLEAAPNADAQLVSVSMKDLESLGIWKKIQRKALKTTESHYIARGGRTNSRINSTASAIAARCFMQDQDGEQIREKSEQEVQMIMQAVCRNQLADLLQLSEEQTREMANCMYLREYPANATIIQKGDRGEHFYVVREGVAELISNPDPEDPTRNCPGTVAIHFRSGSSFGELALLYNTKRKSTIVTTRPSSFWVLDLAGWRNVLSKMPSSRIDVYNGLLSAVPAISEAVPQVEKQKVLADSLEEVYYRAGETVVDEDTFGFTLFIILDGQCTALQSDVEIRTLSRGDYFGEAALFRGTQYAQTIVVASEHATILQLDRETCLHLNLNLQFETPPEAELAYAAQANKGRRSLMRKAMEGASATSLVRLEALRGEIPMTRLETVGILGTGAFAKVSLVRDPTEDRYYALKAMSKQSVVDKGLKHTVVGERNSLAELQGSPFVIELVTTYKDDNCIYLLLEPALGGELFALYDGLDWYGDVDKARFYTCCIALGIDHIHSRKIIHRDIKLENVLVDEKGYAKVTDLGIAKVVIGRTYTVCGTSDYMAPETLKQAGHNRAVDWWALGVLAFAMVAGRTPFDAEDVLQIYKNIVKGFRKELFPSSFSQDLVNLIRSLCKKKPQERLTMLPGGLKNLAEHAWILVGDPTRWDRIASLTYEAPWLPEPLTVEERRARLSQNASEVQFDDYVDDGSGWDDSW